MESAPPPCPAPLGPTPPEPPTQDAEPAPGRPGHPERFFAARSQRWRGRTTPEVLAAWIGGEAHEGQPLPTDRPGLVLTPLGLRLQVPGAAEVYWHPGLTHKRLKERQPDPLVLALDLRPEERVLDGTLGMGYDARILARAGARVVALEARAAIAVFTALGLNRLDRRASRRIAVRCVDHRAWLAAAPADSMDHVYLDPMFPPGREGVGPDLAPLRALDRAPRVDATTLQAAWRVARRRVVVKLAFGEDPPAAPGLPPPALSASHRMRFAIWTDEVVTAPPDAAAPGRQRRNAMGGVGPP